MAGCLYLVGVPIGNDDDITLRALKILKQVDIIAAEDTRKARRLLSAHNIAPKKLVAHHSFNEQDSAKGLLSWLEEGEDVALISDAGMPTVSDPGYVAAKAALAAELPVEIIPGVSAVSTAIAGSGLPGTPYLFAGFLPKKEGETKKFLEELKPRPETLIFFDSPRRMLKSLAWLQDVLGNRQAALCRELTKTHQEWLRGSLSEIESALQARESVLGEITLVVAGAGDIDKAQQAEQTLLSLEEAILKGLESGLKPRALRDELALKYNLSKREIYQQILAASHK